MRAASAALHILMAWIRQDRPPRAHGLLHPGGFPGRCGGSVSHRPGLDPKWATSSPTTATPPACLLRTALAAGPRPPGGPPSAWAR
ncbi:hypothetical protein ACRAWF_33305 [Streptomyces sp. L7]